MHGRSRKASTHLTRIPKRSPGAISSAAPAPLKYRLAPVSRRESSNSSLTTAAPTGACSIAFLAFEAQAALVAHHAFHRRDQSFVQRGLQRGDFGAGVTELMRSPDVFVVLFEYGPESQGSPLFASKGIPRLTAEHFSASRLQRPLPGQLGCQLFFSENNRPFCLYVVAGSRAYLPRIIAEVNVVLDGLEILLNARVERAS